MSNISQFDFSDSYSVGSPMPLNDFSFEVDPDDILAVNTTDDTVTMDEGVWAVTLNIRCGKDGGGTNLAAASLKLAITDGATIGTNYGTRSVSHHSGDGADLANTYNFDWLVDASSSSKTVAIFTDHTAQDITAYSQGTALIFRQIQ
tara:strand:- start:1934 stop:2374 length:441 start_codon:yes stop_codon:yes gene_type:complete